MTLMMPPAAFTPTGVRRCPAITGTGTALTEGAHRGWATVSGESQRIAKFLAEVYQLADCGELQDATDKIFETVDQCLLNEQFNYCNKLLSRIDPRRLPTALMRSFLTITAAAKDKLPARGPFYEQVFQEVSRLQGIEKARRILAPLA